MNGFCMAEEKPDQLNKVLDTDVFLFPVTIWMANYPVSYTGYAQERASRWIVAHSNNRIQTVEEMKEVPAIFQAISEWEEHGVSYALVLIGDSIICGNWFERMRVIETGRH